MAFNKVVKVDEVHGPPPRRDPHFVPAYDRAITNQTFSSELLAYGTDSSILPTSRLGKWSFSFHFTSLCSRLKLHVSKWQYNKTKKFVCIYPMYVGGLTLGYAPVLGVGGRGVLVQSGEYLDKNDNILRVEYSKIL